MKKVLLWGGGAIVAFLMFGAIVGNSPEGQEKARQRQAIDSCWSEQQKKSLDPASQRFVAGACERMEEKFMQQHGHKP